MATVTLDGIAKTYPNGFQAVHPTDLKVEDGEFMVLVGPSGCGKTTLLRVVAGLDEPSAGDVWIGDEIVTRLSPKRRDIAMVFQNYALYPHMTVRQNVGFALKLSGVPSAERDTKVREVLATLDLSDFIDRKPAQLSGGQRQRVAMGRAIVREPAVFLMDEPLSNLDAQLRVQMRAEVCRIQQRLAVTTLYVTHDQVEAMTMGDRIAVMWSGVVQQCDSPQTVYQRPANVFVAAFIGSPAMNLYEAVIADGGRSLLLGGERIPLSTDVLAAHPGLASYAGKKVVAGVRPEDLSICADGDPSTLAGAVELVETLGSEVLVHFSIDAQRVTTKGLADEAQDRLAGRGSGVARIDARRTPSVGERVRLAPDLDRMHFFDADTGQAIR